MKKIIYPAVLVLVLGIGVFLMYSIWGAVSPRTAPEFTQSGKEFFSKQKYAEAIVEFQNALQKNERDRDARFLLARSYIAEGNLTDALKELQRLLEYYPDDEEASVQLGNLYLQGGTQNAQYFHEAQALADKVLSHYKDEEKDNPKAVPAMVLRANALAGLKDFASSVVQLEQALKLDPENPAVLVSLGTTQAVQKNYAEAEQAYLKARQVDPKNIPALISLATYYQAAGKKTEAEATLKEGLSMYPADRQVYMSAVVFYARDRFDKSVQILKDAQEKSPKGDPTPLMTLASLYRAKNQPAEAKATLRDVKAKFPGNKDVSLALAELLIDNEPAEAKTEIDAVLKADPKSLPGQLLLGEWLFSTKDYDGEHGAAATLNTPSLLNSRFPQVHFLLGRIDETKGQTDSALEHYKKSLDMVSTYAPARLSLADLLLRQGRTKDASVELQKVLDTQPGSMQARVLKFSIDAVEKRFVDADKELAELQKDYPNNAFVSFKAGLYYQMRGMAPQAEKSFVRALELQPDSDEILQNLAQFYVLQKQFDRALQVIQTKVPDAKKRAFHYDLIGLINSRGGRSQEAEASYKKALEMEKDRVNTMANLTTEYIQAKRYDDAVKQIDALLKVTPNNASAYATRGMIYQTKNELDPARESYDKALKIDPNNYVAANNMAYLLAEQGRDLDVAETFAKTARRLQPEQPESADTLGWVQHKQGRDVQAREQLLFAVSKQPDNPTLQYHLGMIYKGTKQVPLAQAALRKAIATKGEFKEKALAEAALKELSSQK